MPTSTDAMIGKFSSPDVYLAHTGTEKGRGVYANRHFTEREVVECTPVILIETPFPELPPDIQKVVFSWSMLTGAESFTASVYAIALGFGSLYNHANPANMSCKGDTTTNMIRFTAVRAIAPEEELTINYNAPGGGATSDNNDWFNRMNVKIVE